MIRGAVGVVAVGVALVCVSVAPGRSSAHVVPCALGLPVAGAGVRTDPLGFPRAAAVGAFSPATSDLLFAVPVAAGARLEEIGAGGAVRNLGLVLPSVPSGVSFSPDGQSFAYAVGADLHLVRGSDRVLFRASGPIELGGWEPDGSALVVSTAPEGDVARALLVDSVTGAALDIGPGAHPSVSPDGRKIAVVTLGAGGKGSALEVVERRNLARTRIYEATSPVLATAFSPNSRQVAFLGYFDVEPDLIAQNADGSSTGLFGREHGGLYREIGMLPPITWTSRGVIGNGVLGDFEGAGVEIYDPAHNGEARLIGITGQIDAVLLATSADGSRIAYDAESNPLGSLRRHSGVRISTPSTDRPLSRCHGTARNDLVAGTPLNDGIDVRGGGRDSVSCGRGYDTVYADARDTVDRRCERVIRR